MNGAGSTRGASDWSPPSACRPLAALPLPSAFDWSERFWIPNSKFLKVPGEEAVHSLAAAEQPCR